MSWYQGGRMLAERLLDRSVFVRELLPQDLKLEIDSLTREEAMKAARFLDRAIAPRLWPFFDLDADCVVAGILSRRGLLNKQVDVATSLAGAGINAAIAVTR